MAVKLVELLQEYAPLLASPEYREDVHRQLNEIATREKGKDEVGIWPSPTLKRFTHITRLITTV